jgi:nicotinamide-nucleotide amidase
MRAEILSIGDELTSGERLDTNSQWLAQRLNEIGLSVAFHTTVGDRLEDNVLAFRQAAERADIIVATGGLGPTADDLTRHALAAVAGVPLVQDDASLEHIRQLFARRKRDMPPANVIQAQFPQGSRPIANPHGSAPGIDIEIPCRRASVPHAQDTSDPRRASVPLAQDTSETLVLRDDTSETLVLREGSARVFALPGVPAEMKEMWEASVRPAIQERLGMRKTIAHYRIKCFGVGESDLEAMLPDLIARQRYPLVGITVSQATITLRITAEGETEDHARAAMQPTIDTIHECLGNFVFGYEDDELADAVVRLLREQGKTLAVTEWGTGGLISHWLASTNSADVFTHGTVMADGGAWDEANVRSVVGPDYELLAVARPLAGSPDAPPDKLLVYLVQGPTSILKREFPLAAHPDIIRPRAAKQALNLLRLHLLGKVG